MPFESEKMKKTKFAILGCGRIASRHAQHIHNFGQLLAVCDNIEEKSESLATKYGATAYTDVDALLNSEKDLDVVAVCTPNGLHAAHSVKALEAGFHVLCEKPMALTTIDCQKMIATAEKTNKHLFVVKQNRFNPPIAALKEAIESNKLGNIFSVHLNCFWNRNDNYYLDSQWKGKLDLDGGTLFTQFSHFIDLLYWLNGDVDNVQAIINNFAHNNTIEFEDHGIVNMTFDNGAMGSIAFTINSFGKNMEGSITIFGERGTVKVGGQYLNELEYQKIEGYEIKHLAPGNPANNYGEYVGSMSNHDKVYENVIKVLQGKAKIATSGFDGLKTVEIIEKIYKAASSSSKNQ